MNGTSGKPQKERKNESKERFQNIFSWWKPLSLILVKSVVMTTKAFSFILTFNLGTTICMRFNEN